MERLPPKIVFLDRATIPSSLGKPQALHIWQEFPSTAQEEVVKRLEGAKIAITNKVKLSRSVIEQLPELGMIAVAATGTDNVDTDYCKRRGIVVSNIRDYANISVPEHVFSMILALKRNLFAYRRDIRRWEKSEQFCMPQHPIGDIAGSTFGIVGYGSLGRKVAELAKCFGASVLIAERKGASSCRDGHTPFSTVLEQSDILSLHCPLNAETWHLIGADELRKMKPGALLINAARGGLVDEGALVSALKDSQLGGAGFDVLSTEPPSSGNPLLDLELPNFVLTPHVAWTGGSALEALTRRLIGNIDAYLSTSA